ncbi:hypothetical protein [Bradyrhizobium guangzhouense]|uniref:hypothetical protein n=1 Tax=Bradyrhizobium guangzhouense TaxID=1325095 RepID=UPI0019D70341|nr:hypothetical protein [Bradyrhizobium guangzhouense]
MLSAIMIRETANPFARVAAAKELLDRGWGRPAQPFATNHGPLELLTRIERVIVHPDHPSAAVHQVERSASAEVSRSESTHKEKAE